ncbi:MAG TPA: DUF853 domain-containing protein [Rheinheimera sp.]|uniref:ATP-binding protein n=1 Tax=Rheinheimera sp. TaxID=1869214 RepID=UPI000EDA37AE|nr:ATP-binding protein [Rheinheimera sp.]HCU66351.1 DUF853 domain-containing protein [Rheinheimera sp.]
MSTGWFSPHDTKRRVGSLLDVSATEAKINLTKAGTGDHTWILGTRLPVGEVNEFVFIDCGQLSILARVVKVWLESGERLSVDGFDDSKPSNNPIGLVQLLVSVDVETGYNFKGVKQYPKLGAQVYAAHPKLVSILAEGTLNSREDELQLPIAEMPHDSSVTIHVTPEKLFARHCAVLGSTGGGKSFTMANLIENVHQAGGKVLLLDPTGEFSALPCTSFYVGEHPNGNATNKVTYPHWMFTDSDIRALLRPSAQSQAPKLDAAIQSLRVVTQYHQTPNHGLSINTSSYTFQKSGQQKASFENAVRSISSIESQIPWSFTSLASQIIEECVWPNGGTNQAPRPDLWGGRADNDVGHCMNLISRIQAMASNQHLKWMIDCDRTLLTIPALMDQFCAINSRQIIRLDLSAIPFEANAREILVNAIGRKLLACARIGTIHHGQPLLVFIDEAHQFLNKQIGDESSRFALDAFGNIAKEGRKYGLNVVIATQRPRDIPEDVLSQIGTLIVHRLTNEKDQEVVKKAVGSIDHRSASFLPVLGQGEALLLGVDFPFPMTVKIKTPTAKPESRSASFSTVWRRVI